MSSGAIEYQAINKLHLQVIEDTTLYHFLDAIEKQLDILSSTVGIVQDQFQVNDALGTSLDAIGLLFDIMREDGVTDTTFRTTLSGKVANTEVQTKQAIEDMVEYITGYSDSVDEYPDVDFVADYGLVSNAAIRIRLPINLSELYAADVFQQSNRLVAAGIAIVIDSLVEWFESFTDVVTVEDLLLFMMTSFFDETISGWPIVYGEGWDSAAWDDGLWDASMVFTSDWFEYFWTWSIADTLDTPIDELLFIILCFHTESLTTLASDMDAVDTAWTDEISTFVDVMLGFLDGSFADVLLSSALDEVMLLYGESVLTESLTVFSSYMDAVDTAWTDEITVLDDAIVAFFGRTFIESLERTAYAKIGIAKIGVDIIASSPNTVLYLADWDSAEWDLTEWDLSLDTIFVFIIEVF